MAHAADTEADPAAAREASRGVAFAVAAYALWGTYGLFFALTGHIDPLEVVAHRAFWSVPFAGAVLLAMGRTGDIARVLKRPRLLAQLALSTVFVTLSWGFFVWAVVQGRTLECSLGYYINPLLNVAVGTVFLGERMHRLQAIAIALAIAAVLVETVALGVFPWLPLVLAASFCAYGFARRSIDVGPVQGFFVESCLLSLVAVFVVAWLAQHGGVRFATSTRDTLLLVACGPITALPLMFFAAAARRIRFSTLGLLQYIAPSGLFLSAVLVLGEPLGMVQLVTFLLVWTALALYAASSLGYGRTP